MDAWLKAFVTKSKSKKAETNCDKNQTNRKNNNVNDPPTINFAIRCYQCWDFK